MQKERLSYIDVAKGVLILFLLMGHALLFIRNEGVNDSFINGFQNIRIFLWTPYYMPAFFVITGFCSHFNKPFLPFLWKNFKILKIPAIIFGTVLVVLTMMSHHTLSVSGLLHHAILCWINSGLWFLDALFISKLLYWGIHLFCKSEIVQFISCLSLFCIGFILYRYLMPGKDFGSIQHALMMTQFLFVGQWMKHHQQSVLCYKVTVLSVVLYIITAFSVFYMETSIPFITNKIKLDEFSIIPFLLLATCGSQVIIYLCKVLPNNIYIEYIGRNSLVYYIFNTLALNIAVKLLSPHMNSHLMCIVLYVIVMIFTCAILTFINWIVSNKYLQFTLGKF